MSAQSSRHQTIFADEETSMVKVGVVGCGRIGMLHIEALTKAPGVLPIICSNPTIERARNAAEKFKLKEYCADADDVITHPEVEAVWICSPSQFHAEQIIACAKHGKHVFCEKPIATDLQQTILAIDACRAAGVKLMIGLQRRFDKNFARVKKSMEDKEVGEPFLIKLTSRDPAPPPKQYVEGGGGLFKDMAVHDLDMARYMAGSCPVDIMATGGTHVDDSIKNLPGSERFDTASCIVRFENGMMAVIDVCRQSSYGYDQRAEVLGTKGMIATDNVYPNTANIFTSSHTGHADLPYDFFLSRYNQAYIDETIGFCKSLTHNTPPPVSGKDGLCCLVMAAAADKSANENRWVKFQEIIEEVKNETTEDKLRSIHAPWVDNPNTPLDANPQNFPDRLRGVFSQPRRESVSS